MVFLSFLMFLRAKWRFFYLGIIFQIRWLGFLWVSDSASFDWWEDYRKRRKEIIWVAVLDFRCFSRHSKEIMLLYFPLLFSALCFCGNSIISENYLYLGFWQLFSMNSSVCYGLISYTCLFLETNQLDILIYIVWNWSSKSYGRGRRKDWLAFFLFGILQRQQPLGPCYLKVITASFFALC